MAPETAVYYSSNFVILKFYRKVYFSGTEACQGLHLFRLRESGVAPDRPWARAGKSMNRPMW